MLVFIIISSIVVTAVIPVITVKSIQKHRKNIVCKSSNKRKKLDDLNNQYTFKNPKNNWNYTFHCPSLNKFRNMDSLKLENEFFSKYKVEVFNSLKEMKDNNDKYKKYLDDVKSILSENTIIPNNIKLKEDIYKRYEDQLLDSRIQKIDQKLLVNLNYEYTSPAGRNHYESDTYILTYSDINKQIIDDYRKEHDIIDEYDSDRKFIGGAEKINKKSEFLKSPKKIKDNDTYSKCDFYVTLHIEISVIYKFIYYFDYLDKTNGVVHDYDYFVHNANPELLKKIIFLDRLLKDIYYSENADQIMSILHQVKETAVETSDFHLDMKDITYEMIKELDYKLNVSFYMNEYGDACISNIQIGVAKDIAIYLENNPNSIFVPTIKWIYETLKDINKNSKNKLVSLHREIINKSNSNCKFTFNEQVSIKIDIKIDTDIMEVYAIPSYLYTGSDIPIMIDREKAKEIVYDRTVFLVCDTFLDEIRKINNYYSNRFSIIVKKLITLRESYKDNEKIKFSYEDTIVNSEQWINYFNSRPKINPIVLDELKEGKLVCDPSIYAILRDYQKYAFDWANKLVSNSLSGILADDMGLGKSLEIISIINSDKTQMPNLIVCPVSLLYNWKNEFNKCCPDEKVEICRSFSKNRFNSDKDYNKKIIYIISYEYMTHHINDIKNVRFNYLILDEAQYIKNGHTVRSKCSKLIPSNYRFALTGTPLENKVEDLLNIFDFVLPSLNKEYKLNYLSKHVQKEYISPFLLRRKKSDVLKELPPKNTIIVRLDMTEKQKSLYKTYQVTEADYNDQEMLLLTLLLRKRQICVSPQLITEDCKESSKIDYMFELIDNIIQINENVLIYASFVSIFDIIEPLMKERNIKYVRLDGEITSKERQNIIDEFDNNKDIHCFLISLKAGGVGLNLTKANNVIFLDPWWNIAVENQAADRTHRLGQTKQVNIYRLICKDTVEEKVLDIQKEKLDLINFYIESNGENPLGKLNIDIIRKLLE